jgi:hypothetical protein
LEIVVSDDERLEQAIDRFNRTHRLLGIRSLPLTEIGYLRDDMLGLLCS